MRRSPHTSGFTIVEVIIVFSLLAVVLGSAAIVVKRGSDLHRQVALDSEANKKASRTMERVVRELRGAGRNTFVQDLTTLPGMAKTWSPTLDFRVARAWDGTAVVWSAATRFELVLATGELDNGTDDNGNGLIDEHNLVLRTNVGAADEIRTVLATGVSELLEGELSNGADDNGNLMNDERGFCLELDGDALTIRLSLEYVNLGGRRIVRTQQDTILLRN